MKEVILSLAHRGSNYLASIWDLGEDEVYGTYMFKNGQLHDVGHTVTDGSGNSTEEKGLAQYTPAWLIQVETFIKQFLQEKSELGTLDRNIRKWLITVHVDVLREGVPKEPLAPIISMQPYLKQSTSDRQP